VFKEHRGPPAGAILFAGLAVVATLTSGDARAGLSAQQTEEISQLATASLTSSRLPGLQVAVAKNGDVWSAGFGKADLEQEVPVTALSMFRTASIAKWFTATAALKLVEQDKLDLDAPIQQYCPQYPRKEWTITSRHLLSHLSGIRHNHGQNAENRTDPAMRAALEERIQKERLTQYTRYTDVLKPLDTFKDDPLLFQPGTAARYTSLGYRVLACVLEGAAQVPYRKMMHDLVFAPAGMTAIAEDDALAIIPHRVAGYSKGSNGTFLRAPFRDISENLAAGGYLSTAADVARFATAFNTERLVSAATRSRMLERPKLNDGTPAPNPGFTPKYYYGMGIMVDPSDTRPIWFHTGGQSGATTLLYVFPKSDVVVVLLTNIDGSAISEQLALRIEEIAARDGD
jgi:serine beta-lactamase-like protein LACTB, mitochondrial